MEGPPQAKNHLFCYLGLTHTPPRGGGVFPDLNEMRLYPGFLSEMESYAPPLNDEISEFFSRGFNIFQISQNVRLGVLIFSMLWPFLDHFVLKNSLKKTQQFSRDFPNLNKCFRRGFVDGGG